MSPTAGQVAYGVPFGTPDVLIDALLVPSFRYCLCRASYREPRGERLLSVVLLSARSLREERGQMTGHSSMGSIRIPPRTKPLLACLGVAATPAVPGP